MFVLAGLLATATAQASGDATLFRIFLNDGTTLLSYGEFARSGDRLVFSTPTSGISDANPSLQVVDLAAEKVDWGRTERYAESVRASRYIATQAEDDYTELSNRVAAALNESGLATDAARRLAIIEAARKTLAEWPAAHFFYRSNEVRDMLGLIDEAIANLRASTGGGFDLALVAYTNPPEREPLLPAPTPREAIEQVLAAVRNADSSAERVSLMNATLVALDRDAALLDPEWVGSTRAETRAAISGELRTDQSYRLLASRIMVEASLHARAADVRGVDALMARVLERDKALGQKRPDAVSALLAAVQSELDAARRLRLARDRWALRMPALQEYRAAVANSLSLFGLLNPHLENIKLLAGSAPADLTTVRRLAGRILVSAAAIKPPDEMSSAHAMLISAAQLADNASRIRVEATLTGNVARAWDASSAAAGALMLCARARSEIQAALKRPQLP
jgi:hypothetical protein